MPKNYYNIRDSYTDYQAESQDPVDIQTYISIANGFMKFLMRNFFLKGELSMPERLGILQIVGKKVKIKIEDGGIKGLAPDWKETKKLWETDDKAKSEKKLVYHFNEHTNGVRYKMHWYKSRVLVSNKTLYNLVFTRTNKRIMASLVQQGKEYLIKN